MPNFTIEITAPELVAVLKQFVGALAPKQIKIDQPVVTPQLQGVPLSQMAVQQSIVQAPVSGDNGAHTGNPNYAPVVQQPTYQAPAPVQQQPQYQPAPSVQQQPAYQQAPTPQQAPVQAPVAATPAYTIEQLSVAAAPLMDAGRGKELVDLLHRFGVQATTQLPREAYGAFATELRALGAKI